MSNHKFDAAKAVVPDVESTDPRKVRSQKSHLCESFGGWGTSRKECHQALSESKHGRDYRQKLVVSPKSDQRHRGLLDSPRMRPLKENVQLLRFARNLLRPDHELLEFEKHVFQA